MIKYSLRDFFNRAKSNKLIENFAYLSLLNFFNYLLPLITLPYLIRVLQPENYGLTVYAQTVMLYFFVFIDYGFNITATRSISINKNNIRKINIIFNNVITTKLVLLTICLIILAILVLLIPKFYGNWILYVFTSGILIGQVFFPLWLFQGLQEMKYLMYFNLLSRVIFTILVFVVIKTSKDFIYVNLLGSFGSILVGFLSIILVTTKFNIKFKIATKKRVINELKKSWVVFLSNFAIQVYIGSNIIILGIFVNDKTIGNYSIAEKIIFILRQFIGAFSQAIYPHLCQLASTPKLVGPFFKKILKYFLGAILLICIVLFVFAPQIVTLLVGKEITEIILLIRILCFVPFFIGLSVPSYQTLLAFNQKNIYSSILISAALLNIILNLILANLFKSYGTAVSVVITELFIAIGMYIALKIKLKNALFLANNN